MEQHHNDLLHNQPEVVLSQPAKATSTVEQAPAPRFSSAGKVPTVPPLGKQKKAPRRKGNRLLKALGLLALMICVSILSVHAYIAISGVTDESTAIAKVYRKSLSSVALITSEFAGEKPEDPPDSGTGTGMIYTSHGYIITNAHVVQDALRIMVTLYSGEEYTAQLVGLDENTDIAVLKISAKGLQTAQFASPKRMQRLKVGDTAIVIGNPLGAELTDTLTAGVISSTHRGVEVGSSIVEMLQTDASVSPGNSGGPMFDLNGRVIGIITSKVIEEGAEGIGFAVPADLAQNIAKELISYGRVVSRPMLGITVQSMDQEAVDYYKDTYGEIYEVGMIVTEVTPGSCAEAGGVQVGDKILAFDGYDIRTVNQLNYLKEGLAIGEKVSMKVERNGVQLQLSIVLTGAQ